MPSLFFINSLMLAGLAALGIPILIHLLLKRKKKRVPFSTVKFFLQQDEQSSRRRKLRNWLLLALRLLIVACLVLAFARPYSRQSVASAAGRKQHRVVVIVDRSASMLATGTEGQRWVLAKTQIQKILSNLGPDDAAALVECATHSSVLSGFAPPARISQLVRELEPSYGTGNLAEALRDAVRLLSGRASAAASTICVVSDFQKSACHGLGACPIPQDIELRPVPVGDVFAPNVSVIGVDLEPPTGGGPRATVASFSDEAAPNLALELQIDGRRASSQSLSLQPGAVTNVDLSIPTLKPGWHELKAQLEAKDALPIDDARFATLWVPPPAQVLVVEPRTSARVFEQQTFFLSSALDPTKDSTNSTPGPFKVEQVPPDQVAARLTNPKPEGARDVIVFPGLKDLLPGMGKDLSGFVKAGGGLVLFLGEGVSANRYNSELAELLPARIGSPEATPENGAPWRIAFYDTNCPAFAAFRLANSGDLRIPEFNQRYSLEGAESSKRLAFFDDGAPLVLTRDFGRGKVVLINTSADTGWNDWPKHKTFVPFIHGIVRYAGQNSSQDATRQAETHIAGEELELETGTQWRLAQLTLRRPDGKESRVTADERGRVRDAGVTVPGTYSLLDNKGQELRRIAVNLPPQESNLEALGAAEFQHQLVRVQENAKQTLAAGLFGAHTDQREFWTALLLAALVLLLVEPFVANRSSV